MNRMNCNFRPKEKNSGRDLFSDFKNETIVEYFYEIVDTIQIDIIGNILSA
jgi:hypothetical protein